MKEIKSYEDLKKRTNLLFGIASIGFTIFNLMIMPLLLVVVMSIIFFGIWIFTLWFMKDYDKKTNKLMIELIKPFIKK